MKTIHKFTIKPQPGVQKITVRRNAKLLKAAAQNSHISFWYEVDTFEDWQEINFMVYLTGQELDKELHHRAHYIDTLMFDEGAFVIHVYRID